MQFFARLRRGSAVDRTWRGHHRVSGQLYHITFRLDGNFQSGRYVTQELQPAEVDQLRRHADVELEMITAPVGAAEAVSDDNPPPKDDNPAPQVDEEAPPLDGEAEETPVTEAAQPPAASAEQQRRRGRPTTKR